MLVNTKEMLIKARAGGYAVPAINTQGGTYDIIWACCRAAQERRSPRILARYASTGAYSGHDFFFEVSRFCANKVDVPVAIHLDHGDSPQLCKEMIDLGFTSVMIDASALPVEENARVTNEVIAMARPHNVTVEAELGELARMGDALSFSNVVDPDQVARYLSLCQPDSLAIGIGNAHGFYKGEPNIRLDVLKEVAQRFDLPLVLHGCTGMSEDVIRQAIGMGMAKINFGTQIRYNYVRYLEEACRFFDHQGHAWRISQHCNDLLTQDVKAIIRLSGSEGRA